jgi:hypothetical protein
MAFREVLAVALLVLIGCGENDAAKPAGSGGSGASSGDAGSSSGGSGGSAGNGGTGGSGGTGGGALGTTGDPDAGERCTPGSAGPTASSVCLLEVRGRVVDEAGAPIPALVTSVCGPICYDGDTDATGAFSVRPGVHLELRDYSVTPHGRPNRAGFYFQLPIDSTASIIDIGELPLPAIPVDGPTLVVRTDRAGAPAQTASNGDLTLEVSAGVQIKLDVEDVLAADLGKKFRVLSIPADQRARFANPALGIRALSALAPFESSFITDRDESLALARLSFKNSAGFAAGTAIEVLALGTYLFPEWIQPAAFVPVATARVTSDGGRIEMDPGQGLSHLTWVGLRAMTLP